MAWPAAALTPAPTCSGRSRGFTRAFETTAAINGALCVVTAVLVAVLLSRPRRGSLGVPGESPGIAKGAMTRVTPLPIAVRISQTVLTPPRRRA